MDHQRPPDRQKTKQVVHGMLFGKKPLPFERRITISTQRNPKPFKRPKTVEWILPIPVTCVPIILNGALSGSMDNKLSIYADGPDINGEARLHILHAWTRQRLVELQLNLGLTFDENYNVDYKEPRVVAITWESASDWWMAAEMTAYAVVYRGGKVTGSDKNDKISVSVPESSSWVWRVDRELLAAEDDESREEMAKYVALEACRFIMDVDLVDQIQEPRAWAKLPEYTYPSPYWPDGPEYKGMPGAKEMETLKDGDEIKYS